MTGQRFLILCDRRSQLPALRRLARVECTKVTLLEDRLCVRLLDRSTRRLALTRVGQQVFEHARAPIIEAEAAEDAAPRMQAEPREFVGL